MASHGGARKGAGRPKGSNAYGESTKPMRIPLSLTEEVKEFLYQNGQTLPLYSCGVSAGQPAPADDHVQERINLYKKMVTHPDGAFTVRANGDSMINAGINDGDLLMVNRKLEAKHKKIVVASVDGQLTVKTLHVSKGSMMLMPENDRYKPIPVSESMEFQILGVVTHAIRSF